MTLSAERLAEIKGLLADDQYDVSGVDEVWNAARSLLAAYEAATAWQAAEIIPDMGDDCCAPFNICIEGIWNEKTRRLVREAYYLNAKQLSTEDERLIANGGNDDEGTAPFSGWHWVKDSVEYDEYYEAIDWRPDYKLVGWRPLPAPPQETKPATAKE